MSSVADAFSTPFNWCDRRCERCPLDAECPVRKRERQRKWVHEARGEDPDDPDVWMKDVAEDLTFSLRLLEEAAAEDGIDLTAPLPPRVTLLDNKRLERAAMNVVKWLVALSHTDDLRLEDAIAELRILSSLLAAKIARVGHYLEDGGPHGSWEADAVPNLLLLDRLKREARAQLAGIAELGHAIEPAERALAEIDRLIDPLVAEIGEAPRALLRSLEARNAAPSPFLSREAEEADRERVKAERAREREGSERA